VHQKSNVIWIQSKWPSVRSGTKRHAKNVEELRRGRKRVERYISGEVQFSFFDHYLESSDDFSLIQIGLSNSDLGFKQTVEAGWQEFRDLTGDWIRISLFIIIPQAIFPNNKKR